MYQRQMQGIALILFGILLCIGGKEISHSVPAGLFALIGVVVGVIGLVRVFTADCRN